jgi:mannose-1-phosphate guanylyltransferase/phosphomannomutase
MEKIPFRSFLQTKVPCVWEMKGSVMRKMSEDSLDKEATFVDGIKVHFGEDWVLVLPDQYHPFIHIMSEAEDREVAHRLLTGYREKVETWKKESS